MDRRTFLKTLPIGGIGICSGIFLPEVSYGINSPSADNYLHKMRHFDAPSSDDILIQGPQYAAIKSCVMRFNRIQKTIGYGNFNILSFDSALKIARNYSNIGEFTTTEINILEAIFYENAANYGFYGSKVLSSITTSIPKSETQKIPGSGHFIFKGAPLNAYNKIQRDIGDSLILTSGIRGIVKQMYLFLNKSLRTRGNLSMASRSLAPPGYSYHGISDFDIGTRKLGAANFTEQFANTIEYKKLLNLGYIRLRYPNGNPYGVRHEPWHITVLQG